MIDENENFFRKGNFECAAYCNVRDLECNTEQKEEIELLWSDFRHLAENNMIDSAQRFLYAPLWELELWKIIIKCWGYKVSRTGSRGPDFRATRDDQSILFEATVPRMGTGNDKVPDAQLIYNSEIAGEVPEHQIILRFQNGIQAKHEQYLNALENGDVQECEPFIVAISGSGIFGHIRTSEREMPYIVKSVFPIGNLGVVLSRKTFEIIDRKYSERWHIEKQSGGRVATDFFLNQEYSAISAVLFTDHTMFSPTSTTAEELLLIHNPLAKNPIELGLLDVKREFWVQDGRLKERED